MTVPENRIIDLRDEVPSRVQTAAFYQVRTLRRGERMALLTAREPMLMMQSLSLQLRDSLSWTIAPDSKGGWRVEVRHRDDVAAGGIVDALTRDHKRLDELFGRALNFANAGNAREAAPLLAEFAAGLRRHIQVENEILAPVFNAPRAPFGDDPTSTMLREHDEILAQLALIEACFEGSDTPLLAEVSPFLAILSGTLAKHEYREENNLFPGWNMAFLKAPAEAGEAVFDRVQRVLAGQELVRN